MVAVPWDVMSEAETCATMWLLSVSCDGRGVPFHSSTLPGARMTLQNAVSSNDSEPAGMLPGVSELRNGAEFLVVIESAFDGVVFNGFCMVTSWVPGPGR